MKNIDKSETNPDKIAVSGRSAPCCSDNLEPCCLCGCPPKIISGGMPTIGRKWYEVGCACSTCTAKGQTIVMNSEMSETLADSARLWNAKQKILNKSPQALANLKNVIANTDDVLSGKISAIVPNTQIVRL